MEPKGDLQHLEFEIPSRGLIVSFTLLEIHYKLEIFNAKDNSKPLQFQWQCFLSSVEYFCEKLFVDSFYKIFLRIFCRTKAKTFSIKIFVENSVAKFTSQTNFFIKTISSFYTTKPTKTKKAASAIKVNAGSPLLKRLKLTSILHKREPSAFQFLGRLTNFCNFIQQKWVIFPSSQTGGS